MSRLSAAVLPLVCLVNLAAADNWPGWRGSDRTDVSRETGLLKQWPDAGPERLWLSKECGAGYSGFAVVDGKLYTMGAYEDTVELICMDASTGKILWLTKIADQVLDNGWGDGPRGTPTVDGDHVYAMSGEGYLLCASKEKGEAIWSVQMRDFGGSVPRWGYAESVLIDGEKLICTPGGSDGAMLALDKLTGKRIWQSKEFTDTADYASVIVAEQGGIRQYIQLTQSTLVGVAADDGRLLWKTDWPGQTAVIPTPIFRDGKVYVTSGYGAGCKLVKLNGSSVEEVYSNREMKNHHGGVILVNDHVYGYSDSIGWVCQDFETGERTWSERRSLGKGAIACADGMLYCLSENDGEVVLVDATPEGWNEKGRFTLEPQSEFRSPRGKIWTHPTIADGKLYLRDQEIVYCYDIAKK